MKKKNVANNEKIKKESNQAAVIRNGGLLLSIIGVGGAGIKKYGPKLLQAAKALKK